MNNHRLQSLVLAALITLLPALSLHAQTDAATRELARDIFKQLIEINTTDSTGSVTDAAQAMAARLRSAGFPEKDVVVLGPIPRKENMVARLHGSGAHRPILILGHLDVVEARRSDWTVDPFQFLEKDGYFYGRGTQDMKGDDAVSMTEFIRLKREGYVPDRDLILALTADEEGGASNGVEWLIKNHRDLIDAEFVLNPDVGGVVAQNAKPQFISLNASEKLYADYQLKVTSPGGHSSRPSADNAIYHLTDALGRLELYQFPMELNDITRTYFERMAKIESGPRAADMLAILKTPPDAAAEARLSANAADNARLHTTCVATQLEAGHAKNALPQSAIANVNCRLLPGHSREEIREKLIEIFADPRITVAYDDRIHILDRAPDTEAPPPVTVRADVMTALERVSSEIWPGIPVIPTMSSGASDGVYTNAAGMVTYGISGIANDSNDIRAHGRDERVRVESFYRDIDFYDRFLKALTSGH